MVNNPGSKTAINRLNGQSRSLRKECFLASSDLTGDPQGVDSATPVILTATKISQIITRISHEVVERNRDLENLAIIGVITRGAVLANRISAELKKIADIDIPTGSVDTSLYRDDYHRKGPVTEVKDTDIPFALESKTILLVDDVLFTGRTVNAAIRNIFDLGRPKSIQLAVLIDRGHRELPIRPDYCGKNVPTQYVEKIRVRFQESDGTEMVLSGLGEQPAEGEA